jgi:hypothetical protein
MQVIPQYIPDLFTPVFQEMSIQLKQTIYYDWGHREEVTRLLTEKDNSKTRKPTKFPLAWLVMDFKEAHGDNANVYAKTSFSFVFAVGSEVNFTEQERRDKSFIPILLPMYAAFLNIVGQSTIFRMPDPAQIKHGAFLRPYWGNGQANIFNEVCDCLEINNLQLDVRALTCAP